VIPEKVKLVKEIFRLALLGLGAKRIAQNLPNWDYSIMAITRTVRNRAVLGEHTVAGEPIMKYPQIIEQKIFDKVQELLNAKNAMCSDGNIRPHTGARNSEAAANLFQGLIFDADGERPLHYRGPDSQRHSTALVSKFDPKRKFHRLRYDRFEADFLKWITTLDWKEVVEQKETPELGIARSKLNVALAEIDKAQRLIARRTLDMEDPDLPSQEVQLFSAIIVKAQQRLASLMHERSHLEARISQEESKADALYHPNELLALVRPSDLKNNERRLRLREEIRRRVSRIDFYFEPGVAVAHITFVNGIKSNRCIIIGKDKSVFVWDKPPIDEAVKWLKAKVAR
jgi:hypothetical protein